MGVVKSGYGQKQGNQYKKRNQYKLIDGDVIYRILPVSDKFTTDPYKWIQYHAAVYGYKNMKGKHRLFESTLQKKNKEIVTPDAAVERIESLKTALLKAQTEGNGALAKQLNDLVGQRGVYSVDKKYHMNVMNLEGMVGTLAIPYTSKAYLDDEIKKLQAKGIDPLSLDNGRYFVFSRSNTGAKTAFSVRVLEEEVEVPGHGKLKKDVVAKDLTTAWAQIEQYMTDLSTIYQKITPEEVAEIVKESELKTGKSPACDRIFDARWKAQRDARKAAAQSTQTQSGVDTNDDGPEDTLTEATSAPTATLNTDTSGNVQVNTTQTSATVSVPVKTQAETIDGLSDDEFWKACGIENVG